MTCSWWRSPSSLPLRRYWLTGAPQEWGFLWQATVLFTLISAAVFWHFGLYRGIWYYASVRDLGAIVRAVTTAVLLLVPVLFVFTRLEDYPRSALPLLWGILTVLLTVPRFAYRALKDGNLRAAFGTHATSRRACRCCWSVPATPRTPSSAR